MDRDELVDLLMRSNRPEVVIIYRGERDRQFPVDMKPRSAVVNDVRAFVFPPAPAENEN